MKKVRSWINVLLSSLIAALGLNSCAQRLMYGPDPDLEVLYGPAPIDTTIRAMYGVPVDTTVEAPVVCKYGVNAPTDWDEPGQEETK